MYTVLIVDDEKKVCQLINHLVDWESLNLEVIGMAHSGSSAIEFAREFKPDIIITDIRMPNVDGIELIKTLNEKNSTSKFIIISGYRHFEYAHEAMKLGVEHYLLKPIDKTELLSALQKIVSSINHEKDVIEKNDDLEQYVKLQEGRQIDSYIDNILKNRSWERADNIFQSIFSNSFFTSTYIKIDAIEPKIENITIVCKMIKERLCDILIALDVQYYIKQVPFGLVVILNTTYCDQNKIQQLNKMIYDCGEENTAKFDNTFLTLGVSQTTDECQSIPNLILEACTATKYRIKLGVKKIIYFSKYTFSQKSMKDFAGIGVYNKMNACFETFDKDIIIKGISLLFSNIYAEKNYSPALIYEALEDSVKILTEFYTKINENAEFINNSIEKFNLILNAYFAEKTLYYYFTQEVANQIDFLSSKRSSQASNNIKLAQRFMQQHYQEQISLNDVADAIGINPSYLSACFKKDLNKNYSEFLIEYRINAAKQLLQSTQLTIAEISDQIGYTDPKYFSKLFKKVVGLKPSAYRKLYF